MKIYMICIWYVYDIYIIKNINEENENQKGEVNFKIIIELIIIDIYFILLDIIIEFKICNV